MSRSHYQRKKTGHRGSKYSEGIHSSQINSEEIRRACDERLRKSGIDPRLPDWVKTSN